MSIKKGKTKCILQGRSERLTLQAGREHMGGQRGSAVRGPVTSGGGGQTHHGPGGAGHVPWGALAHRARPPAPVFHPGTRKSRKKPGRAMRTRSAYGVVFIHAPAHFPVSTGARQHTLISLPPALHDLGCVARCARQAPAFAHSGAGRGKLQHRCQRQDFGLSLCCKTQRICST